MPDRDAARRWIELRHTGQNSGRGIVDWNGVQTARFRGDKVLDLIEYVKVKGNLNADEKSAVATNFPITTLDRIVSNPAVRQKLGIQITDGEYYFLYPEKEQVKVLKKIVLDLASKKIKVDAVKTKDQQIQYVDGLPKEAMPSGSKLKNPDSLTGILKAKPAPQPPPPPPPPSPLDRKNLVPKTFTIAIANQKAAQLLHELRTLNIDKFPIAAAVTLRSFVEANCEIYGAANSLPSHHSTGKNVGKPLSLNEKVESTLKHLGNTLTKQELTAARLSLTSKDSVISVGRLHEYVHNPAVFPVKSDLISEWSGIEVFFRAICK